MSEDLGLIFSSWSNGAHECVPWNYTPTDRYAPHQLVHMERCVERFDTRVACHFDDPSEIMAWVCYTFQGGVLVVHWMYVKNLFRKMGMAKSIIDRIAPGYLVSGNPIVMTQWSKHCKWARQKAHLVFDPYYVAEH